MNKIKYLKKLGFICLSSIICLILVVSCGKTKQATNNDYQKPVTDVVQVDYRQSFSNEYQSLAYDSLIAEYSDLDGTRVEDAFPLLYIGIIDRYEDNEKLLIYSYIYDHYYMLDKSAYFELVSSGSERVVIEFTRENNEWKLKEIKRMEMGTDTKAWLNAVCIDKPEVAEKMLHIDKSMLQQAESLFSEELEKIKTQYIK